MSMRIGESLVEQGLITPGQLDKALRAQLIFGGHLGTSLIEMGYVDEERLGRALSLLTGVPYASFSLLQDIPDGVIKLLPAKLVQAYKVIPIHLQDKVLRIAAIQPKNLAANDEISFVSGFRIEAWVAPEIRILQAMEKYYGIPRPTRYITICQDLDKKRKPEAAQPDPVEAHEAAAREAAAPEPGEPGSGQDEVGEEYGYGTSWQEIADEKFDGEEPLASLDEEEEPEPGPEPEPATPPPPMPKPVETINEPPRMTLQEAVDLLSVAESKEDLANTVLSFAEDRGSRGLLFRVRGALAQIWDCRGFSPGKDVLARRFPITRGTILDLLLGNEYYLGPVPDKSEYRQFYSMLGGDMPREILLVPAYLHSRLTAVLYLESDEEGPPVVPDEYRTVLERLAMAIELAVLKKRIRTLPSQKQARGSAA
jgi:hypothetical protein